ncbi:MAG TPA: hypothetical protein VJM08_05760 [Anaerolineales bacterium]|nr:hypothetical protein [Anaerolineales bacterium]
MQKWPYSDFGYVGVEPLYFMSQRDNPKQKREYLTVEAVFSTGSENAVLFFDHYTKLHKGQRSEFDEYLDTLNADGWKLTYAGNFSIGRGFKFRRYHFRRVVE